MPDEESSGRPAGLDNPAATEDGERDNGEERFVEDLVVRGEAVPEGTEPLTPGATHEVVADRDGVPAQVRRRRFSAHG